MRTVRILLFGSLALLAFGIAGLALFVWFGSPNAHRWVAHKALEAALDRDVQVDGSLTVELGAEPLVQLTGLRIDSPPWAESPALLLIERAEVRIALRPLLRRVLVFPHIALEGVTVNLETAADGRHSWETDARPASTQDRRESVSLPVFESVSVSDATVTYHDLRDGRRTQVHIASLTNQSNAASGGTRLDAHGEIDGQIFRIGGTTGSLDMALAATEPYPVDFALHLPAVEIQLTGTVADVTRAEGLDLRLQAQSPSLRDAIEGWNMSVPVDMEITADARLTGDLAALSLTDFSAEMVSFGGDRLDLTGGLVDVWEGSGLEGRLTAKLDPAGEIARSLPESWRIVKGVEAAASISGSIAAPVFEEVSAEIQGLGDSRLSLAGDLRASTAQAVQLESFNLTAALVVPDPSVFADQLGFNPSGLGPWRGEAKLVLADRRIEVSQLRIDTGDLGTLSLEGGGAIGVSTADGVLHLAPDISFNFKMPESGPVLRLIDLELPEFGPVQATGRLFRDDRGYRLGDLEVDLGTADKLTANARGEVGPIVAEDAGATELDLTVNFGWPSSHILGPLVGQDLPELGHAEGQFGLAGTIADMRMRDASLKMNGDGGVVMTALGEVAHIRTLAPFTVEGVAFDLEVQAPSTTALAILLGQEAPDFGPVHGRAALGDHQGPMALTAIRLFTGPAEAPSIEVSGTIGDVLSFEMVELEGKLEMPTNDLLALADLHGKSDLGRLHGRVRLSDADGSVGIEHFEARVTETHLLSLAIEGMIEDLENIDLVEVQASLEIPNVANLADVFDVDVSSLKEFHFDGTLSGDGRRFNADGRAVLGETRFDVVLAGDFTGARPSFTGSLQSPHVRLADFGLIPEPLEEATPEAEVSNLEPRLFDSDPIPIESLRKFDLDIDVRADDLDGVALAIDQAKAHVLLTDGVLHISSLQFGFAGGRAEATVEVDTRQAPPTWRVHAETDDAKLGDLWRQFETEVPLSGELDLELDLHATGRSPRDLANSLEGDLSFALQRGQLQTSLFYLTTTDPIRWLGAGSTRRGYAEVNCLVARFHVTDGIADAETLVLDTPNAMATGQGSINFADETFDLQIRPSAKRRRLANLTTPFAITGDLASPSIEINTGGAAARMVGEVALSPVNLLGSLLPFVGDDGRDEDNPCLDLSDAAAEP